MDKKAELLEIQSKILPILKKHKVIRAGIFGSYARGEQTSKSDVDLLVELDDSVGFIELIRLKLILEEIVKRKVDLIEYDGIRKELRHNILSEEINLKI